MFESGRGNVVGTQCHVVVIWIDWYAYHLARFEGLQRSFGRSGEAVGIEWVGGAGVHKGFRFREERLSELPVETMLPNESWSSAGKLALAQKTWRRLNQLQPRMVLIPGYYTLPAIAAAVWARTHQATSVLMTESTATDHPRSRWKEILKAKLIRALFGWAVVGGRAHRHYLARLAFAADRIRGFYDVVGNDALEIGTLDLRRTSSNKAHGLPERFFLFVGRLAPEKNVDSLLQAWLAYRERGGQWSLVLAGDGPELPALLAILANSRWAGDVLFLGHKTSKELLPIYAFASCFVLPSIREPWGLVVNEAMAAGLPVIVSDRCGCAPDLIEHGVNGLLFNPADVTALCQCLTTIANTEAAERERMSKVSSRKIKDFSPDRFGTEVASIARSAMACRVDGGESVA